jgi:DNA-directed RNA polymerase subunit F
MSEEILSKEPIAVPLLVGFLKDIKKENRAEVQERLLEYSKRNSKLSEADCKKLVAELKEMNIPGFTPDLAVALANVLPATMTEIKSVLSGKSNINPENFKKIQEVLTKYSK